MYTQQPEIYLIEDNLFYQAMVLKELEGISSNIKVFSTGESFLDCLENQPELVILDHDLDTQMNGCDILKEIRKYSPSIPVIFFSANMEKTVTSSILSIGVQAHIEKNIFALPFLKEAVERIFEEAALYEKVY